MARDMPITPFVELSNGLTVANFSSPHPFTFEDGKVLEACSKERCERLALEAIETVVSTMNALPLPGKAPASIQTIRVEFRRTEQVTQELEFLSQIPGVDVILVPLPVLQTLRDNGAMVTTRVFTKVRCIRVKDRVTKVICIDKFCI